ncbi:MAG: hypothetical protein ACLUUF_00835 [Bifidobacterium pullorum]
MVFDPTCGQTCTDRIRRNLYREGVALVVAVEHPHSLQRPDFFRTRLIFPSGDRATDLMNGIPSELLNQFPAHEELTRTRPWRAGRTRQGHRGAVHGSFRFLHQACVFSRRNLLKSR